ncbi:MAG: cysteine--tRNA ligase [Clostridia bacterium]|nr:cysteine--tRNA ligase [Clostridia bacterium]
MKIYNTLTREKEEFITLEPGKVKMYACGPTVYNYFHIGNARCFVVFDMLRRYLRWRGYDVTFVQNFTDVDDKMIKRANEEGTTVPDVAERYIREYYSDAKGLGVEPATIHPRATENIDTIIDIVSTLIERGYAYESNGDVYFRTKAFKEYGKLSHMPIDDLESGARIDVSEVKEDPLDFALWKAAKPDEPHWTSPWGEGRPGWHIECSAMVRRYLGETIDLHCGGQDLTFPHHENEIAQSECCTGKPFARYWMHNGYINVDNKKMSKSLGNFFTVRDVAEKYGYLPIRHFILSAHYRSPVNYSTDIIEQSKAAVERILTCADNAAFYLKGAEGALREEEKAVLETMESRRAAFIEAMDDDFNTADGMAALYELVRDLNSAVASGASKELVEKGKAIFDDLAGLLGFVKEESGEYDSWILEKIALRTAAKRAKNYAEADAIRAELLEAGIILEDTAAGTKYKRK